MKEIPIFGYPLLVAVVDDADYDALCGYRWYLRDNETDGLFYAVRTEGRTTVRMHRQILGLSNPKQRADHKNGNGLDNQRHNLRLANHFNNMGNSRKQHKHVTTSKYKGVVWDRSRFRWCARIALAGKSKYLGRFREEFDAATAYNFAAEAAFGEFARYNLPLEARQ